MNPELSLYRNERELIRLLQNYNDQEQYVKTKLQFEKLKVIKECFVLLKDMAETRISFQTNSGNTRPYIKISPESSKDLCKTKNYAIDFYGEAREGLEMQCSGVEETINDIAALMQTDKEHLRMCESLKKSCDFVVVAPYIM